LTDVATAELLDSSAPDDRVLSERELTSPFSRASQQPTTFVRWPDRFWAKNYRPTVLWSGPQPDAANQFALPQWSWLEFMGEQRNGRILVRFPGDGRIPPREAWVTAVDVMVSAAPLTEDLPRAYPAIVSPTTVRVHVPYVSQLDSSPWAEANCGPTALAMALQAFGTNISSGDLRKDVLNAQGMWGDDSGVLMEALAQVGEMHGARVLDLRSEGGLKRWTLDDVRSHVRSGNPVIPQVVFRALPGREQSPYWGDHFVVITGLVGEDFLYNDPVDSDGIGYDRLMTAEELSRAMQTSDRRYTRAAFALGRS
jgi:hypothetical protein